MYAVNQWLTGNTDRNYEGKKTDGWYATKKGPDYNNTFAVIWHMS